MAGMSSYLDSIQSIKGTKPNEKYKIIIEHIKTCMNAETKEVNSTIWQEMKENLQPLYKWIIANMTENYDLMTELLKSEDMFLTTRVFKSRWYFQGKNEDIINPEYFFQHVVPYVTLKNRREIVKSLGRNLKNTEMAGKFFIAFEENYGVSYSLPLLFACTDNFVKKQIEKHRIILSVNQVDRLYLRKPNVVVFYFDMIKGKHKKKFFILSDEIISNYTEFLPKLIKRNPNCFYNVISDSPSLSSKFRNNKLDRKYAQHILKKRSNGQSLLEENPCAWIDFIELKMINETMMNTIFPKLLPNDVDHFRTMNLMNNYLQYYPKNKVYKLISESYEIVYKRKFLDNLDNVTVTFVPYLPVNVRNDILHLLKSRFEARNLCNYENYYDCYLPTKENWNKFKKEINKAENDQDRVAWITRMIYNCKVNNDTNTLCKFLEYINRRHKNERLQFWETFFSSFCRIYEFSELGLKEWSCIDTFITNLYVNRMLHSINDYSSILQKSIMVKYNNESSKHLAEEFIDIYLEMVRDRHIYDWPRYHGKPQDEDSFFTLMVQNVEKKFSTVKLQSDTNSSFNSNSNSNSSPDSNLNSDKTASSDSTKEEISDLESSNDKNDLDSSLNVDSDPWNEQVKIRLVRDLVKTMYELDQKFALYEKKNKIMRKKLLPVPFKKWRINWLWLQVEDLLMNKSKVPKISMNVVENLEQLIKDKDPEIYEKLLNVTQPKEFTFRGNAPFKILKRNPKEMLKKVTFFLDMLENYKVVSLTKVKRFFTMCHWYDKLPIKFAEEAEKRWSQGKKTIYFCLMGFILDGRSYDKLCLDYFSKYWYEKKENVNCNYIDKLLSLQCALKGMRTTNPPTSLEIIHDFYQYECLFTTNIPDIIFNLCMKTSLGKVQRYLRRLLSLDTKIIVQKSVIRINRSIENIEKCAEYLLSKWMDKNEHPSVRMVVFNASYQLFINNPRKCTWFTLKQCMENYDEDDWSHTDKEKYLCTDRIPIEYINDVIETTIKMTTKMIDTGLDTENKKNAEKAMRFLFRTIYLNLNDYYNSIIDDRILLNFIEKYLFEKRVNDMKDMIVDIISWTYLFGNEDKYLSRLEKFGQLFERYSTCEEWYDPIIRNKNPFIYSNRLIIVHLLEKFQNLLMERHQSKSIDPIVAGQMIDQMINIFYKMPIYYNIWSYIMLILTKYYIVTPKEFYDKICNELIPICKENKCTYVILTNALDEFFQNTNSNINNDFYYKFIDQLLNNDKCSLSKLTAVQLLPLSPFKNDYDKHNAILDKLRSLQDPQVFCLLNNRMNRLCLGAEPY